jgi:hypothetical protein
MKKIENWLLWPVLILVFYGMSKYSNSTFDIHFHDTYYLVSNATIAGFVALWLAIVIIFLKLIRHRHQVVNVKFTLVYMVVTLLLFCISWLSGYFTGSVPSGYSDFQLNKWVFFNQLRVVAALSFLLVQVIFVAYFVVQLVKKPVIQR